MIVNKYKHKLLLITNEAGRRMFSL